VFPAGFEPVTPEIEKPQAHALDWSAIGRILPTSSQYKRMTDTNWYIYIHIYIYIHSSNFSILSSKLARNMWRFFFFFFCDAATQRGSWPPHFLRFLDHTQRCTTVGSIPLDEWSARRRDLYLTTHNTHNRQTSMPPVGFKPTISAGERPQTHALDRAATGTGYM